MNSADLINVLTVALLKPLFILLLLLLLTLFLRKKSASLQHFVLALGLIGVLLLPLLTVISPSIPWRVLPQLTLFDTTDLQLLLPDYLSKFELLTIAALYFLVASWLVFYFLLGVVGLYFQTRSARPVRDEEFLNLTRDLCELLNIGSPPQLVTSAEVSSPQMWGLFKPVIMLPTAAPLWSYEKKLTLLIHELGHVRRHDWFVTLAVKLTCALFWFLPPVWWFSHKL
jgi:bla regulator protein blaR1